ncbi:hypothetical protein HNQ60_003895 [Povalibacter uvarum]|uniref:Uncharacterized protein n=1 Tax=Povalibacter uvarum TaxID=732238 RepID=A0A841HSK4_9GAMM|nr:hypothetical protein [Povalibacter uvarum]MBB6095008.1 hypothetical protein [Povalibacter uvarum]
MTHFASNAPTLPQRRELVPRKTRKEEDRLCARSMSDQATGELPPP